jgi:aspartate-semialdehyde dehydrogenase
MAEKLRVGILGATGAVGQNYALLLENHPWFEVSYLAASPKSAGKPFGEAVGGKWFMDRDIPRGLVDLIVGDASKPEQALRKCDFVFSSYEGSKEEIQKTEMEYAEFGIPVVSNNSAHRWTEDVPMIIPEINHDHLRIIPVQQKKRGFTRGFVVTKPNCSIQSFLTPVYALRQRGCGPRSIDVVTMQAVSGAGYPGVPSLDMIDNIVPYIGGEENKTENEPLKIFGIIENEKIKSIDYNDMSIRARCTRVPVIDGHTACVTMDYNSATTNFPSLEEVKQMWNKFTSFAQGLELPSAPNPPIIYREEENRPQPRKDRMAGDGMAVSVGGLKQYELARKISFVGLSHNTIRGAAGGAILTAELLKAKGYL